MKESPDLLGHPSPRRLQTEKPLDQSYSRVQKQNGHTTE